MINLFEFNNYKIDTKKLDHLLHGSAVRKLEEQICEYVGAKYCASFCSASFIIELMFSRPEFINDETSLDIPSMIPPVVPNALHHAGMEIYLNDDVDWVGHSYVLWQEFGGERKIIDSAQQIDRNQFSDNCNDDDYMIFSLYPTKPLSSLDGGLVVSNNKEGIELLSSLGFYGMKREIDSWSREPIRYGHKTYLPTIQAEMALENLRFLDERHEKIDYIRNYYNKNLGLKNTSRHLYRIRVDNNQDAIKWFKEQGIITGVHYKPIHQIELYNHYEWDWHLRYHDIPKVNNHGETTLSIPFHHKLQDNDIEYIVEKVQEYKNA